MKRASIIIALLLVVATGAFALEATVTWSWSQNDPDVKFFRYQLDGEEDGKWTVVDADVFSASYDIDVSVEHTLYLQQSYDGANWSASSYTVSEAVQDEVKADAVEVAEAPAEAVEAVEVVEAVEEAQSEEVPVEAPTEEVVPPAEVVESVEPIEPIESIEPVEPVNVAVSTSKSRIDFGVAYGNVIPFDADGHLVGASIGYTFLFGRNGSFGYGAKVQFAAYTTLDTFKDLKNFKDAYFKGTLDALFVVDYAMSWGSVYLGIGGEVGAPFADLGSYAVGATAQLGAHLKLGKAFGFGLEVADCYYLYPATEKKNAIGAKAYLSFEF